MARSPMPFSRFEWLIARRYLRARRAEGGVAVMTWISIIGITLAVFALIATLAADRWDNHPTYSKAEELKYPRLSAVWALK